MILPEKFHINIEHLNVHRKILSLHWLFSFLIGIKAVLRKIVEDAEVSLPARFLDLLIPTC